MLQEIDTKIFKQYSQATRCGRATTKRLADAQAADLERRKFLVVHYTSEALGDAAGLSSSLLLNMYKRFPEMSLRVVACIADNIQSSMAPALIAYCGKDKSALMDEYLAWQIEWRIEWQKAENFVKEKTHTAEDRTEAAKIIDTAILKLVKIGYRLQSGADDCIYPEN